MKALHASSLLPFLLKFPQAQWLSQGLYDMPAELFNFDIPEQGINVTGNAIEWLQKMQLDHKKNRTHPMELVQCVLEC